MSLFVLREGYRVVTTPSGARVVHVRTGGAIDLSPEQVLLFARATAGGVDARDPKLRNIIRRFVTLGVLVSAGDASSNDKKPAEPVAAAAPALPTAPAAQPQDVVVPRPPAIAPSPSAPPSQAFNRPPPESPTSSAKPTPMDVARPATSPTLVAFSIPGLAPPAPAAKERTVENPSPRVGSGPRPRSDETARLLRGDLQVRRRDSSSLLDVTDPQSGKTFPLYDFEVSLARMLDGRRLYCEVVEAGQRLGIPVDLESLTQFVSQLDRYGFLAPVGTRPPEPGEGESTWAPRQKWDEGLRALFQSGLRMHRQGRYAEAANYFEAMLQQDPQNPEASEMLDQSRQRMSGGTSPSSEGILSPPDSAQVSLEGLFFGHEEATPDPPAPLETVPTAAAPTPPPRSRTGVWSAERVRAPEPRRMRWPIPTIIACSMAAGLAVVGYLVFMNPKASGAKVVVNKPATVERQRLAVAAADGGFNDAAARSSETGQQARGIQQRSLDAGVLPIAQSGVDAGVQVSRGDVERRGQTDAGMPTRNNALTAERVAVADAGILTQEARREWIAAKIEHRGRVTMAEVAAPASGVISWSAPPNQRVRRGETIGTLRERGTSRARSLVAPREGLFIPKVRTDGGVSAAETVAAIVYHEAYLQASLGDARPQSSWSCEVYQEDSSTRADCKIVEVVRRGAKSLVTATTEPLWFDTARDARVRVSPPQ